jgi:hypothetical protein
MHSAPLKTAVDLAQIDDSPSMKLPLDERELEFLGILNSVELTPEELRSAVLRENRIQTLFDDIGSIHRARLHFNRLAAAVAGTDNDLVPESAEWVAALQQLRDQQRKVEELATAARAKHEHLARLRSAVARLAADLKFEQARIGRLEADEQKALELYFTGVVGGRNELLGEYGVYSIIRNAREVAAFTRDVVMPKVRKDLAKAEAELAAFEAAAEAVSAA